MPTIESSKVPGLSYSFKTEPMEHQMRALKRLSELKGVCGLLMEPGTGKTKVVIDYLGMLYTKFGIIDVLVLAPLSALDTWEDQLEQHLPDDIPLDLHMLDSKNLNILDKAAYIEELSKSDIHMKLRILVMNHDVLGSKELLPGYATVTKQDRVLQALRKWRPSTVVVDESHKFKGHTSSRARGLRDIRKEIAPSRRIIMTGTVTPRNPLDLYAQWLFLNPERFGDDWHEFRHHYARWGGWMNKEIKQFKNQPEMRRLLQSDSFIATKEECLDLPKTTDVEVKVRLSKKERKAYDDIGKELMTELEDGTEVITPIVLTKILRQRQITGGFLGYEDEAGNKQVEELGNSKIKVMLDLMDGLINNDEKIVVFAHYRHDIEKIRKAVASSYKKIPLFYAHGGTASGQRKTARKEFSAVQGAAVFVAQIRTMGLAVNEFVSSSNAIFYSLSERRDDWDQARDRLNRMGQTKPVTFYYLVVPDSVDTALLEAHKEKLTLERSLFKNFDKIKKLG